MHSFTVSLFWVASVAVLVNGLPHDSSANQGVLETRTVEIFENLQPDIVRRAPVPSHGPAGSVTIDHCEECARTGYKDQSCHACKGERGQTLKTNEGDHHEPCGACNAQGRHDGFCDKCKGTGSIVTENQPHHG